MAKQAKRTPKEERIAKGNVAKTILADPVVSEAYENLRKKYINDWQNSSMDDVQKRERAFLSLHVLADVRAELESIANSGSRELLARNE